MSTDRNLFEEKGEPKRIRTEALLLSLPALRLCELDRLAKPAYTISAVDPGFKYLAPIRDDPFCPVRLSEDLLDYETAVAVGGSKNDQLQGLWFSGYNNPSVLCWYFSKQSAGLSGFDSRSRQGLYVK